MENANINIGGDFHGAMQVGTTRSAQVQYAERAALEEAVERLLGLIKECPDLEGEQPHLAEELKKLQASQIEPRGNGDGVDPAGALHEVAKIIRSCATIHRAAIPTVLEIAKILGVSL